MLHTTYLTHTLHKVCEESRKIFQKVDSLNSSKKKNICKSTFRILTFNDNASELPLPPQPIITRWDT